MNGWRARGIALLIESGRRALTADERAEMIEACGRAAS